MAKTVTLAALKAQCRQRADMENSQFISDSELLSYINGSAAELYDLLVETFEDYYLKSSSVTILSGTDTYSLPSDFYKLKGVDLNVDAAGNTVTMRPFMFAERNAYAFTPGTNAFGVSQYRYQILGNNIRFVPVPQTNNTVKLWYIPAITSLALDADTLDGVNGYEEYIILDTAIKMKDKEESDVSVLMNQKAAMKARIQSSAVNRDAGEPSRISDVSKQSPIEYFYFER